MELVVAKVIILILITVVTLLFGIVIPLLTLRLKICRCPSLVNNGPSTVLTYINCLVGGVFLGTTLLHMIPEATEKFETVRSLFKVSEGFPLTESFVGAGFFLIVLLENILMMLYKKSSRPSTPIVGSTPTLNPEEPSTSKTMEEGPRVSYGSMDMSISSEDADGGIEVKVKNSESQALMAKPVLKHCHSHQHIQVDVHSFRTIVLLLALCIHTVFEGLAIGLLADQAESWGLAGAILAHKVAIAFSLGAQILRTSESICRLVILISVFAVTCPLGIIIGLVVLSQESANSSGSNIASAVLQSLASGTFLYITFFEFLNKELLENNSLVKILLIALGFSAMMGVTLLE